MTLDARNENIKALAIAAGISEERADVLLDCSVLLTYDDTDQTSRRLATEVRAILGRTLTVEESLSDSTALELVLGSSQVRSSLPKVYADLDARRCRVGTESPGARDSSQRTIRDIWFVVSACYTASAVVNLLAGECIKNRPPQSFEVSFSTFLSYDTLLDRPVEMGEVFLAGAGAVGCGFLWGARHSRLRGTLHLVDDDHVSSGNLQRQIWYSESDVGKAKAQVLALKASEHFPECQIIPAVCKLQEHPLRNSTAWLSRLVVAVDSRRTRRFLQNELPGEVFDASTTGSQEIVFHFNREPNEYACLGCVYPMDEAEVSQEELLAGHLGVQVADLGRERIDASLAARICQKHSHLSPDVILGLSFDTLYKQLCGADQLKRQGGEHVIAPLAFVSVLAGTVLFIEFATRVASSELTKENEWRLSPWRPPVPAARWLRPRRPDCSCCGTEANRRLRRTLWG